MKKLMTLTEEQLTAIGKDMFSAKAFKDVLGINLPTDLSTGDTSIRVNNANVLDLYRNEFKGFITYYIVMHVIDSETAFGISLY